ncbi:DUF3302 domain-containing protein [Uliginosibacterium sp. H3]|uniref:DUF3302 domain-containing protein n=1 Tax=Uliginosibacterium silvisoli TaxID=3114758 RepID=A0ABU6JZU1_9RHOO|nr:DUF3302 domain-containing protein [Uliginosibacterium sp. H3]
MFRPSFTNGRTALARFAAILGLAAVATPASASFLSGDALDAAATGIAWFVVVVVPIVAVVLFWIVHVMPEKIAHKRHHPQKDAIHTLCLLSLVFGGLLWPFAWLWAYTKPVAYRVAYGTEKHDDYYHEMGAKAKAGEIVAEEIAHLKHELDEMAARGVLPAGLKTLRNELAAVRVEPTESGKAGDA